MKKKDRILNCMSLMLFTREPSMYSVLLTLSEINQNDKTLRVCEAFIIGKLDINNKVICFHDKKKKVSLKKDDAKVVVLIKILIY